MTHAHFTKQEAATQTPSEDRIITDTGWHKSQNTRVRTLVVADSTSEIRRRWFDGILLQCEKGEDAA